MNETEQTALNRLLAQRKLAAASEVVRYAGRLYARLIIEFFVLEHSEFVPCFGPFPNQALHPGVERLA